MAGERFVSATSGWEQAAGGQHAWVLAISGEVDLASAPELTSSAQAVPVAARLLVVELAHVTFVDAAGLGALKRILGDGPGRGLAVQLRNPNRIVRRVVALAGPELVKLIGASQEADA